MLIRVAVAEGLVGWAPGLGSERMHRAITGTIAPFLEGRTLADPDALRVQFLEGPGRGRPELAKVYCTVEIALFDVLGKALGVPVSELAGGGRLRDHIQLYGSAGMYMSPQQYAAEAAIIAELGFPAYKMRPGLGPDIDLKAVQQIRKAVGPDIDVMVDAHTWWRMGDHSYSLETVEQLAEGMAQENILWLEEPLPPEDHEGYLALKEKDIVSLAGGEHEPDEERFLDLILTEAVDYVQMDICCQGGFSLARRLLGEIQKEGLRFAFHSWGTALEVVAAAHLGICWPENVTSWLEYPVYAKGVLYPFPLASEILKEPLRIEKGDLVISRDPGLGVEINESVIDQYPWIPGPWSLFHLESPQQTLAVTADHSVKWESV